MRRLHIQRQASRRENPHRILPLDPRDPHVLRAKELGRSLRRPRQQPR
jgi:hypothetical protein